MNRNAVRLLAVVLFAISTSLPAARAADSGRKLADIYRTGHARLVAEAKLDMNSMPQDVFLGLVFDLAVDDRGNVYVLDFKNCDIKVFDGKGKFLRAIGRKGQGPGEFLRPTSTAASGDKLIVYDVGSFMLSVLDLGGKFMKSIPWPIGQGSVEKIRALPAGRFLLENEKFYFYPPGKPQDCSLIVLDPGRESRKEIYAQQVVRNRFVEISGGVMNVPQPYAPDVYWGVLPGGLVVVGFSETYGIEILDPVKGKTASFAREWEPVKVTAEDRKQWLEEFSSYNNEERNVMAGQTVFPKHKPAFDRVFVDPEGNILVHPITGEHDDDVYDAFAPDGNFISRVKLSGVDPGFNWDTEPASDGSFWSWTTDPAGEQIVAKWRITE